MDSFNSESGRKVAEAIDRRVMNVAKNIYENSPNNKTKFGTVLSSSAGLFNVKIDNVTYTNISALKNVGNINRGEVVICLVPNNQYSNMIILGVADGTLQKLYGTDIELARDNPGNLTDAIINVNRRVDFLTSDKANVDASNLTSENITSWLNKLGIKFDLLYSGALTNEGKITIPALASPSQYDLLMCCFDAWNNTGGVFFVPTINITPGIADKIWTYGSMNTGANGSVKGTSCWARINLNNYTGAIECYGGYDNKQEANQTFVRRIYGIKFK